MKRVNVGCGMTPTPGWLNLDNSFSTKLAKHPMLVSALHKANVIGQAELEYINFCRTNNVIWADAVKQIPIDDASAEVVYSSHMLEHLDHEDVTCFLRESIRVLCPGGVIRIAVPDISKLINMYSESRDAERFVESTHMCVARPRKLIQTIKLLIVGPRHHQWMYDGKSLCAVLDKAGFKNTVVLKAGETTIKNPDRLDLREREAESVYVEAVKT